MYKKGCVMNIIKKSLYGVCFMLAAPALLVFYGIDKFYRREHLDNVIYNTAKAIIDKHKKINNLSKNTKNYKELKSKQERRLKSLYYLLEERGTSLDMEVAAKIKLDYDGFFHFGECCDDYSGSVDLSYLDKLL